MEIGRFNRLKIERKKDHGLYLSDDEGNEVLLPTKYIPENYSEDEALNVFVFLDNEERPVATTETPLIVRDGFGYLKCSEVNKYGAFLDMGLSKELFCPFKEQAFRMQEGHSYLVRCYLDEKTGRLAASSKTNRFLDNSEMPLKKFDEVELIISHPAEIGMNVIVNEKYSGLIHSADIFKDLKVGDRLPGLVKKVRPDNKLDIVLGQLGYKAIEPNAEKVLNHLKKSGGFVKLTDKSAPDEIKAELQMSKKAFKKAIGNLYKNKQLAIESDGIRLLKN